MSRADRRDLPRDAVFLGTTPLRLARSNRLTAWVTAASASPRSPVPIARRALATPVRVAVRTPLFRCPRFTCCRATFFAGNSFLLCLPLPTATVPSLLRRTPDINHSSCTTIRLTIEAPLYTTHPGQSRLKYRRPFPLVLRNSAVDRRAPCSLTLVTPCNWGQARPSSKW